jgi:hypothetical protein
MEFWQSIFREDADEDEVNRIMMAGLVTSVVVAGTAYVYAPRAFRSLTSWWNRQATSTPTHTPISAPTPEPATSGPTVRNNRATTQSLPGTFIEQDGDNRDMSPDDFRKLFSQYNEQDVANMKAGWKKCLEGRAADDAACKERTTQLQAEARNARQTERIRVDAEARRARAAETRADMAEARAIKSENDLSRHMRRYTPMDVFSHHPDDKLEITRLKANNQDLQRQLDACMDSRRRSLVPEEVEEFQKQLKKVQEDVSDRDKRLLEEIRKNRNIKLREDKADKIMKEHASSGEIRLRLRRAKEMVNKQKVTNEQQRLDLAQHEKNAAEYQRRIDRLVTNNQAFDDQAKALKGEIKEQKEELRKCKAEVQRLERSESGLAAFDREQLETIKKWSEAYEQQKTWRENAEKDLVEQKQEVIVIADAFEKLRLETDKLESEADTKDATVARLRKRLVALRSVERSELDCEECKNTLTLLQDWQKMRQNQYRLDQKKHADLQAEFRAYKSTTGASQAGYIAAAVKTQLDTLQGIVIARGNEVKKLTDKLDALKFVKGTNPDCEESCRLLQAENDLFKATTTTVADCEKCSELLAEVARVTDLLAKAGPNKRLQQIIDQDATIKALQQELVAAKANANGGQQPPTVPADLSGEIDQLKIWLEEVRIELSGMVGAPIGEVRIFRKEEFKPNELAQLLRDVQEKCERAEAYQDEVSNLKKEMRESNLADLREEILTLNEQLAAVQAELRNERAPTGGARKPDDKIKKIITLENKLKDSERQRRESESSTNAADIRVAQLEVKVTELKGELQDARSSAPVGGVGTDKVVNDLRQQLEDAKRAKTEAERDLANCQTKNAGLVSELEALKIELEQTKKERDDCRDKDLPGSKQKIAQLEAEVTRVRNALAGVHADLDTAEAELAALQGKSSGSSEATDGAAKKEIRMLTSRLDAKTLALAKSRTKADETTTYVRELMAQVDQLTREKAAAEKSSGSNAAAEAAARKDLRTLTAELDASKVELGKSRTTTEEQTTKVGELTAQLDQLTKEKAAAADSSGMDAAAEAVAQGKIRDLTTELDASKVALGKSGTIIDEQKAKVSDLAAQLDQLKRDSKGDGSKDNAALSSLQQERDAALSNAVQTRQQADQVVQQARTEVDQIRAAAIEKVQQADAKN